MARGGAFIEGGGVAVEGVHWGGQGGQSGRWKDELDWSKSKQKQAKASKNKQKQANGTIGCTAQAGTNRAKLPTPSGQGYSS